MGERRIPALGCGPEEEMMSPLLHGGAGGGAAEGEPAPRLQLPRERSEPTSGEPSG